MTRIAVLWSETSYQAKAARALAEGRIYRGVHCGEPYRWLIGESASLGVSGVRHCLWRLGQVHDVVGEDWVRTATIDDEVDALIVPEAESLDARSLERVEAVAERGRCWLIVSGASNLSDATLGVVRRAPYVPRSFVGTRLFGRGPFPVSPPGYAVHLADPLERTGWLGDLEELEVDGGRSLATPAVTHRGTVVWIPVPFFEYLGALVQAHTDGPGHERLGREAIFYADGLCRAFREWVRWAGAGDLLATRISPWGRHEHGLVLRHDTDDSSDDAFLELEDGAKIPATYAVLPDARAPGWVSRLRETPGMELALHYRTNRDGFIERVRSRLTGRMPRRDVAAIVRDGLCRQVREARDIVGRVETIHRHYHYLLYPEFLLALERLFDTTPEVLGAGSFARFDLTRWGERERVVITAPHVGVPFWFPIRPVIATAERHVPLRGWESAALIEPSAQQVTQCLDWAATLPGGCYTWVFHPAHARGSRFAPAGTLVGFQDALRMLDSSWWIATSARVYERASRWSQLSFRVTGRGVELANLGHQRIDDVTLRRDQRELPLGVIEAGGAIRIPDAWMTRELSKPVSAT